MKWNLSLHRVHGLNDYNMIVLNSLYLNDLRYMQRTSDGPQDDFAMGLRFRVYSGFRV